MSRPFRFALQAMDLRDPAGVSSTARSAEAAGYEELYSYDHMGTVDPFAPLMVAALATERLRVGPLVLNNEFHHPALLARTAATVDRMTDGRLVLGIGTGYMESEHEAIGLPIRPPGPRVSRLAESLAVLRSLLDDDRCQLDGDHHQVAMDRLGVRPAQPHVPFLIGGHGRRVVGLAARYADIFQFTGLTHGPGGAPQPGGFAEKAVAERARWLQEAAGDRDGEIERSTLVQVSQVGGEVDAAVAQASKALGLSEDDARESPFLLVGSPEQLVDKLERQRETLGISHVVVRDLDGCAPLVEALAGR